MPGSPPSPPPPCSCSCLAVVVAEEWFAFDGVGALVVGMVTRPGVDVGRRTPPCELVPMSALGDDDKAVAVAAAGAAAAAAVGMGVGVGVGWLVNRVGEGRRVRRSSGYSSHGVYWLWEKSLFWEEGGSITLITEEWKKSPRLG